MANLNVCKCSCGKVNINIFGEHAICLPQEKIEIIPTISLLFFTIVWFNANNNYSDAYYKVIYK